MFNITGMRYSTVMQTVHWLFFSSRVLQALISTFGVYCKNTIPFSNMSQNRAKKGNSGLQCGVI